MIHLVATGTSILSNLARRPQTLSKTGEWTTEAEEWIRGVKLKDEERDNFKPVVGRLLASSNFEPATFRDGCAVHRADLVALQSLYPKLGLQRAEDGGLSSELGDLYLDPANEPRPNDLIVLLASDSAEGLASAAIVAAITGRRVSFVDEQPELHARWTALHAAATVQGECLILRVEDLGIGGGEHHQADYEAALGQLARRLVQLSGLGECRDGMTAYLSGGYKVTLLHLVQLLELLAGLWAAEGNDRPLIACYRHETMRERLPVLLRSIDFGSAREEVEAAREKNIRAGQFKGYLWRVGELTAIGRAVDEMWAARRAIPTS